MVEEIGDFESQLNYHSEWQKLTEDQKGRILGELRSIIRDDGRMVFKQLHIENHRALPGWPLLHWGQIRTDSIILLAGELGYPDHDDRLSLGIRIKIPGIPGKEDL